MIQMSLYDDIIKKKKKDWQCEALMDAARADRGDKIPFSSPLMNWSCYGGIPRNKITEFFGEPGGGKSSSAVDICKNAVKIFKAEHEQIVYKDNDIYSFTYDSYDRLIKIKDHRLEKDSCNWNKISCF